MKLPNKEQALKYFFQNISLDDIVKEGDAQEYRVDQFYYIYGNRELIVYDDNASEGEYLTFFADDYGNGSLLVEG